MQRFLCADNNHCKQYESKHEDILY